MRVPLQSREEFESELQRIGLGRWAPEISNHARWGVRLTSEKADSDDEMPLGATKLGGSPDLPIGMAWPCRDPYPMWPHIADAPEKPAGFLGITRKVGQAIGLVQDPLAEKYRWETSAQSRRFPLAFIAQYNLSELSALGDLDIDLPKSGLLSLFYDNHEQPWGSSPSDKLGVHVVWSDAQPDQLKRCRAPEELRHAKDANGKPYFPAARLRPTRILSPLEFGCHQLEHLNLPDELLDIYGEEVFWGLEASIGLPDDDDAHQIGGWPDQVQGDMQLECQLVSNGLDWGEPGILESPEAQRLTPGALDWSLLLQIISDDNADMQWCDGGSLFVWMKNCDLKARKFENARLILQTS